MQFTAGGFETSFQRTTRTSTSYSLPARKLGAVALCASCGTPFLPTGRRPRKDLNAYCSEWGLKAALRDAAARYRQTQKYRATNVKWRGQRTGRENV